MAETTLAVPDRPALGGIIVARCNPYGNATMRGPRHLLGGVYDAGHEGRYKWECRNPGEVRARMRCRHGHRGQEMTLCRPHVAEIQKRMAGLCPPCAYPPAMMMQVEIIHRLEQELAAIYYAGGEGTPAWVRKQTEINDAAKVSTELTRRGIAHNCQLKLDEVS